MTNREIIEIMWNNGDFHKEKNLIDFVNKIGGIEYVPLTAINKIIRENEELYTKFKILKNKN